MIDETVEEGGGSEPPEIYGKGGLLGDSSGKRGRLDIQADQEPRVEERIEGGRSLFSFGIGRR